MARANEYSSHSSSDEDISVSKWKQAIKDEVEEDLTRQVRLRLKVDPLYTYCKHSSGYNHSPLRLQRKTKAVQDITMPPTQVLHQPHCMEHCIKQDQVPELDDTIFRLPETPKNSDTKEITNTDNEAGINDATMHMCCAKVPTLSGILDYVNVKYGVPRNQLKNLSEKGRYKTKIVDTSGCGSGPSIKFPLESHKYLPTPKHGNYKTKIEKGSCQSTANEPVVCETNYKTKIENGNCQSTANETVVCDTSIESSSHGSSRGNLVYASGQETKVGLSSGSLEFESGFESGNLLQAFHLTPREYILWLTPDLYSKHHTQWFYFRLMKMVAATSYTFHIVNFYKPDSLYNYGMQPLLYSEEAVKQGESGWTRVGQSISYHPTNTKHVPDMKGSLYTLTWTMEFPYSEDTCYLAHCFPYTYSQLLSHLSKLEKSPLTSHYISRETLCHTLAGNACPLLTITDFDEPQEKSKMGVVITARVHPGETNSSWMMQGLIDFLTSECAHAHSLRSRFIFKLIPMLNPDGVIVGNYRTSLTGVDLNRVYKSPPSHLFPTVYHTKATIEQFGRERKLLLYVDLHGHSRKHNVFMYGCHTPRCDHLQLLQERVIPFLLSQQAPLMFDFRSCKFCVERCKESTGRVVTWRMGVPNSFTMESTFYGSTLTGTKHHFSADDLISIGKTLAEVIHVYHHYNASERYRQKIQSQIAEVMMSRTDGVNILPHAETSSKQPAVPNYKKKRHCTKVLNKFIKIDTSLLEQESSTSGSDSEDDNFSWRTKKVKRKSKSSRLKDLSKIRTRFDLPQLVRSVPSSSTGQHNYCPKTIHSAPSKLSESSSKSTLPSGWKFVNKYQNRSNGGIPIYSEERLQERKEKNLQSTSSVLSSSFYQPEIHSKMSQLWKTKKPAWTRQLEPIKEVDRQVLADVQHLGLERITKRGDFKHLKLSPQLAKYISEIWKSY